MSWDRYKPRGASHGAEHAKARKVWALQHQPADPCVRCGHPLGPMGSHLHLDHHDWDKSRYLGFSHGTPCPVCNVACNLSAGGARGRLVQKLARTQVRSTPLRW